MERAQLWLRAWCQLYLKKPQFLQWAKLLMCLNLAPVLQPPFCQKRARCRMEWTCQLQSLVSPSACQLIFALLPLGGSLLMLQEDHSFESLNSFSHCAEM